jgi:hypothetical protein
MNNIEFDVPQSQETLRSGDYVMNNMELESRETLRSGASNYVNGKGIIEVTLTDNPIVNVLNVNNVQKYEQY